MGFWSGLFACDDFNKKKVVEEKSTPPLVKKKYTNEILENLYDKNNLLMHNDDNIIFVTPYNSKGRYDFSLWSGKKWTVSFFNKKTLLLEKSVDFYLKYEYVKNKKNEHKKFFKLELIEENSIDMHEVLTYEKYEVENIFNIYRNNKVKVDSELKRLIFIFLDEYVNTIIGKIRQHTSCRYGDYYFKTLTHYSHEYEYSFLSTRYETLFINEKDRIYKSYFYSNSSFNEYVIENYDKYEVEKVEFDICEKFEDIINESVSKEVDKINSEFDEIISNVMYDYELINNHLMKGANDKLTPIKSLDDFKNFVALKNSYDFTGLKRDEKAKQLLEYKQPMFIERVKFTFNF